MNDAWLMPDRKERLEADIAIGCFAALCRDRLADRLLRFSGIRPEASIGVRELALAELLPAVAAGCVALAIAPADVPARDGAPGLESVALWREAALVAVAANDPLAARPRLAPADLARTVMLLPTDRAEGEMQRYLLARLFGDARPPVDARSGRTDELMRRVAAGEGVALALAGHETAVGVVTRPISAPAAQFAVRAWWRADACSPALATLLRVFAEDAG